MKSSSYNYGIFAEYFVIFYLMLRGYRILARRFKTKMGEIDIIATKNKELIAFEVKARRNTELSTDIVRQKQRHRIFDAVNIFLNTNNKYIDYNISFSIILYKNIFNFKIVKG